MLGVCVTMKESEIYWREFLNNLKNRGLLGVTVPLPNEASVLRLVTVILIELVTSGRQKKVYDSGGVDQTLTNLQTRGCTIKMDLHIPAYLLY